MHDFMLSFQNYDGISVLQPNAIIFIIIGWAIVVDPLVANG
jgi:hypothetical protein